MQFTQVAFRSAGHRSTDKAFDVFQRLVPKIGIVQLGVMAVLGHQVIVGAIFDDATVIHDDGRTVMADA
jgi:hypothetical protein